MNIILLDIDYIDSFKEWLIDVSDTLSLIVNYISTAFKGVVFAIETAIEALPITLLVNAAMPWVISAGVITTVVIMVIRAIFGR